MDEHKKTKINACLDGSIQVDWFDTTIPIKVLRISDSAKLPTKAHPTDAGYDLYANLVYNNEYSQLVCTTGLAFEIPVGYVGLLFPRSSLHKYNLSLSNAVGVIDSGYRGEVSFVFNYTDSKAFSKVYEAGDRIGQLIILPYPEVSFTLVDSLSESSRGAKGLGSSGV